MLGTCTRFGWIHLSNFVEHCKRKVANINISLLILYVKICAILHLKKLLNRLVKINSLVLEENIFKFIGVLNVLIFTSLLSPYSFKNATKNYKHESHTVWNPCLDDIDYQLLLHGIELTYALQQKINLHLHCL